MCASFYIAGSSKESLSPSSDTFITFSRLNVGSQLELTRRGVEYGSGTLKGLLEPGNAS